MERRAASRRDLAYEPNGARRCRSLHECSSDYLARFTISLVSLEIFGAESPRNRSTNQNAQIAANVRQMMAAHDRAV